MSVAVFLRVPLCLLVPVVLSFPVIPQQAPRVPGPGTKHGVDTSNKVDIPNGITDSRKTDLLKSSLQFSSEPSRDLPIPSYSNAASTASDAHINIVHLTRGETNDDQELSHEIHKTSNNIVKTLPTLTKTKILGKQVSNFQAEHLQDNNNEGNGDQSSLPKKTFVEYAIPANHAQSLQLAVDLGDTGEGHKGASQMVITIATSVAALFSVGVVIGIFGWCCQKQQQSDENKNGKAAENSGGNIDKKPSQIVNPGKMASHMRNNTKYHNWIKIYAALLYLKEGIAEEINQKAADLHNKIKQDVGRNCPSAVTSTCQPKCTSKSFKKANHNTRWTISCASNVCNYWLDELMKYHEHRPCPDVKWVNCDPTLWPSQPWEVAKVFQPIGCATHRNAEDSDIAALLTFVLNCTFFDNRILPNKGTILIELKEIPNLIKHSGTLEAEDADMVTSLDKMIALLEDPTHFGPLPACKTAADKIRELKNKPTSILCSAEDKQTLRGFDEMKHNICTSIRDVVLFGGEISLFEPKNRPPVDEILQRLEDHTLDPPSPPASPGKRKTSTTGPGHVPVTDQTSGNLWTNGASDQQSPGASAVSRSSSGFAEGSGTSHTSNKYSGTCILESSDVFVSPLTFNRSTGFSVSSRHFGRYLGDTVHETSDYDTDTEYKLLGGAEQTWQRGQAGGKLVLGLGRWQTNDESYTSSSSMDYEVPIFGRLTNSREIAPHDEHEPIFGRLTDSSEISFLDEHVPIINSREMSSHDEHETMCTWQQALDSKNEHVMMKLIKAKKMPEASDLQRAFQLYRENSITDVAIDTICGELCQHIKGLSDKIRSVYSSYTAEKPEHMVFIVMADTAVKIDTSYDIIVCHPEGYSQEGSYITYHDIRREKRITQEESDGIAAAIQAHAKSLFDSHSNIHMISGCSVKSQGFGTEHSVIDRQTCIVIYVSVKGKIPLHEKPFPVKLNEPRTGKVFPVDVREGGFQFFGGPRDYHQNLKMGCQITDLKSTGTLGAIVEKEGRTYCLTCAHVFLENLFFSTALANNGTYGETENDRTGDIRVYQGNNTNHFGVVAHAASYMGNNQNAGIDIAVIEITDQSRTPIEGSFPDGNMETSGFTASTPMIYTKGKVFDQSGFKQHVKCHTEVVKYGSETEYTKGLFDMQGFCAKRIDYTDQCHTRNLVLNNQLVVLSAGDPDINPFAKPGDSGALVFGKDGGNWSDLRVVGLIEGGASNKTVAVTPIWDVLTHLGINPQSGLKEFASPPLPLDSGFISQIGSLSLSQSSQGPIGDVRDQARSQEIAEHFRESKQQQTQELHNLEVRMTTRFEIMQRDHQQEIKQLADKLDYMQKKNKQSEDKLDSMQRDQKEILDHLKRFPPK